MKDQRTLVRRGFLKRSGLAALAASPWAAMAQQTSRASGTTQSGRSAGVNESLSRQFARWAAGLRYEDLPATVVDRAKGLTLQALSSVLLGYQTPAGQEAIKLVLEEEAGASNGASVMVNGTKATKGGAAYANAEMALAGGKWDTFRMLTHPGTAIVPAALAAAETGGASGRDLITALAAGYEVTERLAADFIPTVMARGFHAGPVFAIFGAAVAAAKIMHLNEDQVNNAIGLCVNLAGGNIESGGLREGGSARNAMFAVALARLGHRGGETALEGRAGFYEAFAGNNQGRLTYSFTGQQQTSLDKITANLGKDWTMLETLYRIYSISGYNIAHIDVTAKLCEEHNIRYADVDRVEAVVNWMETQYPSPAFPALREDIGEAARGSTRYYAAWGVVRRGFPMLPFTDDPPEVLELMKRVTIIPSHEMTLFGPRITIFTKDGKSYTKQATGREFIWDFEEEARRIRAITPGIPIPAGQYEEIISVCRGLDRESRADRLVALMRKPN
ncbi:MAG TPA: MmgE/PrpD family protein [Bryobacteraceae bacterium]